MVTSCWTGAKLQQPEQPEISGNTSDMRMVSDMSSLKAKVFGFDMICGTYSLKFDICLFWYI